MAASAASRELFTDGVRAVLHTWPVLQIAVDNGFGGLYGQQKADWMVDVVQQYFHDNADLQQYEVEDFIAQLMNQEFDTVVDDGSLPQVSVSLLQVFSQWQQGALQQLKHTINTLTQKTSQRANVTAPATQSDDDSDDETQVNTLTSKVVSGSVSGPVAAQRQCLWVCRGTRQPGQVMDCESSSPSVSRTEPRPPRQDEEDGWTVVQKKK